MFALVEDGSITKMLNGNRGITINGSQYPRAIYTLWTKSEREAIGIYEVVWDRSNRKDETYYVNTNISYSFGNGKVTASYGSATAKAHADSNWTQDEIDAGKAPDGADTDTLKARGLKYNKIQEIKKEAAGELARTDWYIVRKADTDTAVPSAITNHRAAVRTKCAQMETAITNASNTAAIETLYTRNAEGVRPLGDLPILEV